MNSRDRILKDKKNNREILCYEQVDICYGEKQIIRDCSFSVQSGEILGIVGESGSGKSTLIRAAMGLLGNTGVVTRGDIWYQGKDLPDLSEKEMRKLCGPELAYIFQEAGSSFCPIRTILDQMYESVKEHQKTTKAQVRDQAEELLSRFGFQDPGRILKSYPFELSGGMKQRVGIAAAMLLNPKVLFADEPTSALDVTTQKQVVEEMLMVRETFGTSILLVTHNIGVVRATADQMLVLKDGKRVEYGATGDILENPQSEYTKKLLSAVPVLRR
ncbi:MAG: ABC transporter ATP-binding protein [Lachnospiraceae bacterium]|nr:ABC transporter ATP-binding protein [Lachnospiraceae bacterium]